MTLRPGPTNSLVDVAGLQVGHYQRIGDGWLTGTTVVVAESGATGGVDVRGGAPGTRETDLLAPHNVVDGVHAVTLTGGSAYGLAAATGVMHSLGQRGIGYAVGAQPGQVVPIVPAAVIYDLARGGEFDNTPDAEFGVRAVEAAAVSAVAQGCVGAGVGAVAGGIKGGVGSASAVLPDGATVAALVVVNAAGGTVNPHTGSLWGVPFGLDGEFAGAPVIDPVRLLSARATGLRALGLPESVLQAALGSPLNTTIGVVATNAVLTAGQCQRLAMSAHDGLARAVHPAHLTVDGDTFFALSTKVDTRVRQRWEFDAMLAAGADAVTRAVIHAVLAARTLKEAPAWTSLTDLAS